MPKQKQDLQLIKKETVARSTNVGILSYRLLDAHK